jgi:hypothetical protein
MSTLGHGISEFLSTYPRARCNIRGPEHGDPAWRLNVTTSTGDVLSFDGPTLAGVIRLAETSMLGNFSSQAVSPGVTTTQRVALALVNAERYWHDLEPLDSLASLTQTDRVKWIAFAQIAKTEIESA